ncbi:cysteine proteinase, partial [Metschnikowia bicuspidata var. bicuspidata NRRL YB-4993]
TEFLDTELPTLDEYDKVIRNFYTPIRPVPPPKYSLTDAMLAAIPSYDFSQFLRKERERIQAVIFLERKASQSKIKPLSDSQLAIVESKWKARNTNERIVSDFSIDITVKDIQTLKDSSWLNDNVIDFYLNLVAARSTGIFCWTTHFFSTLKSKGYQGVARWAKRKKVNLLEKDLVIVPINIMSTHWALAVIDNQAKLISYYDSLASRGNLKALQLLSEYMSKESERLLMPQIAYTLHANVKTPQQQNGFDCGVFTCTVAKCLSEQLPLSFSQKDMRLIRRRMAYEIINNNLL